MARLNTRPALAGLAIGTVAAIAVILLPATALESIVARTHLASVLSAAQPPLGFKARVLLGLIPFVLASALGLVVGLFLGGRKRADPYGDYGDYADYESDTPVADPFAPAPFGADPFAPASQPTPVAASAVEPATPPVTAPAPPPATVAPPLAIDQLDTATAADLAEIAEAVVRLNARLDSIEAKLDAAPSEKPAAARATTLPADLSERLAKIAKSLDAAG